MQVNNLYVYFNENGQILSRTPYCENGEVRQGSTFILNFLFEKGYIKPGNTVSVMFKWPGQNDANTFPYISFYEDYNLKKDKTYTFTHYGDYSFDKDLSKFGIKANKIYDCWQFYSVSAVSDGQPSLTELDGNLEITPTIITDDGQEVLGTARIFIEKDPTYKTNFQVSTYDLNRFLSDIMEQLPKDFVRDVYGNKEDYSIGYESLTVDYVEDDELKIKKIDLPVPTVDEKVIVTENVPYGGQQTASVSGNGKAVNPLQFNFDLYKAKDGFGVVGFEIDEQTGHLILFDERGPNAKSEYELDPTTGCLMVKYLED